jgi:hypothetical protein
LDGIFLSRDDSLDESDYPLVDRGSDIEVRLAVRASQTAKLVDGKLVNLKPGESYTNSATFTLPSAISGDFKLIVKADTNVFKDQDPSYAPPSSVREGLPVLESRGDGAVLEFKDEGNNTKAISLPIRLATPPDLQVTRIDLPAAVTAGQSFNFTYRVDNLGGATPQDQGNWYDLIYLSKDRNLDLDKDRYVGYVPHYSGLAAGGNYEQPVSITPPRDFKGAYYVFVVTDPARAWGSGEHGRVYEFGSNDENNSNAQAILINQPPPADLQVASVTLPAQAQAQVGDEVSISYTVKNASVNPAYGNWTDAIYLSSDNTWDLINCWVRCRIPEGWGPKALIPARCHPPSCLR